MDNWLNLVNGLNATALSAFGRDVRFHPQSGGDISLRAIFQATHEAEEQAPGVYGLIFIQLSNLPVAPQRGDRVVVGDSAYSVYQIQSDASGGATLSLRLE
jgi:hypothetical protein